MRDDVPRIVDFVAGWTASPFGQLTDAPWVVTASASALVARTLATLGDDYDVRGDIAIHRTAEIENGAVLKGPVIVGPQAFIGANAYLRGGVFLAPRCVVGPCCELKTTLMFDGAKVAHLSFVGDSILGADVNVEAGAVIANYRNEENGLPIVIRTAGRIYDTGVTKFGSLVGDGAKIGANAVLAPGAIIEPGARIERLALIDQGISSNRRA